MKKRFDLFSFFKTHQEFALPLVRIFLGGALFIRGLILVINPQKLTLLAGNEQYFGLYSYIAIVHLLGGALLFIGFLTRFASLIQIPILFVALFFIHIRQGFMTSGQGLELSILVLFLLILFFLFGGGKLSLDDKLSEKIK